MDAAPLGRSYLVHVYPPVVLVGFVHDALGVLIGALVRADRVYVVLQFRIEELDDAVRLQVSPDGEALGALAERLGLVVVLLGQLVR
ncbi:hypothetical protein PG991_013137 [Apiospora marii]|uniref:Uncharacterized protein n=1 Tax=Apiospora marii TaxID=335849 RepID=A0ABR1R617_9PEZI